MSNPFAIAQVTASLSWLLAQAAGNDLSGFASTTVTNVRPDLIDRTKTAINVFLYLVTPSAAGRNADAVTRRADGTLLQKPRVALELHYLLSFIGDETRFEPQILLASAVRTLHASPILDRATIASALAAAPPNGFHFLRSAAPSTDLDAAPDLVRFTPTALSLEELSKLWSGLVPQTTYLLSTAYQASIVFLDGEGTPAPAAPPVRAPVVLAVPLPAIEALLWRTPPAATPAEGPVVATSSAVLTGRGLGGISAVTFDGTTTVTPSAATDTAVTVPLPAGLAVGPHTLAAVVQAPLGAPTRPHAVGTGTFSFVLQPSVTVTWPGSGPLHATFAPPLVASDDVVLVLRQVGGNAVYRLPPIGGTAPGTTLDFAPPTGIVPGTSYLVRAAVNGVEGPSATARLTFP